MLARPNQIIYGLINLNTKEAKETKLGFSFRGNIKLYLNGNLIYAGKSTKEQFEEYTYNRFRFSHEVKVNLHKGENRLLVKTSGESKGLEFTCCALKRDQLFDNSIEIRNNIENSYINNWLVTEPFETASANPMDFMFEPERTIRKYYIYNDQMITWQMQQPLIQQALKVSPFTNNKKGFNADWHYANSNTLLGMLKQFQKVLLLTSY